MPWPKGKELPATTKAKIKLRAEQKRKILKMFPELKQRYIDLLERHKKLKETLREARISIMAGEKIADDMWRDIEDILEVDGNYE